MGRIACTEPQCLYKGALYLYLYPLALCCKVFLEAFLVVQLAIFPLFFLPKRILLFPLQSRLRDNSLGHTVRICVFNILILISLVDKLAWKFKITSVVHKNIRIVR
jgi:hypothetical protein